MKLSVPGVFYSISTQPIDFNRYFNCFHYRIFAVTFGNGNSIRV
jgi:hypothetical protein